MALVRLDQTVKSGEWLREREGPEMRTFLAYTRHTAKNSHRELVVRWQTVRWAHRKGKTIGVCRLKS